MTRDIITTLPDPHGFSPDPLTGLLPWLYLKVFLPATFTKRPPRGLARTRLDYPPQRFRGSKRIGGVGMTAGRAVTLARAGSSISGWMVSNPTAHG